MSENDNDEPTVVIDFESLKKDLNKDEILTEDPGFLFNQELEVIADEDIEEENEEIEENKKNLYFFDYQSEYFDQKFPKDKREGNMQILKKLPELNKVLTQDPESIIVFYYNEQPKAVNQLTKQIKDKFPKTKTLIIAKKLSPEKARAHKNSKYGANAYLSDPFEVFQFFKTIRDL